MCTRQADRAAGAAECSGRSACGETVASTRPLSGLFPTPWGEGSVTVWQGRLAGVELPPLAGPGVPGSLEAGARSAEAGHGSGDAGSQRDQQLLERWVGELERYFRGERLSWTAEEIALDHRAMSAFTRAVYETLLTVPAAVTVSYGVLAEMAGFPGAARAVGTAMATNFIPIVVPCHRVIKSDGSLGRYGSDSTWKERLLAHERRYAEGGGDER